MNDRITKLCQNLKEQGVNQSDINSIVEKVKNYYKFIADINFEQMDYLDLLKSIQYAHFQYVNNVNDENIKVWNETQVYSDGDIIIWKPRNFIESCIIGTPQWCVSYRDFRWDEHVKYNGDTIYMIYNAWESGSKQFVSACVERNGNIILYDSEHNRIEDVEKNNYLKSLGEGVSILKPTTNENKQYNKNRNMKQTIKFKESELKRMICETVKRVLKESQDFESPFWYIEDDSNTINGYYDDMEEAIEDAKSFAESGWRDGRRYFVKDQNQKVIFDTDKSIFENIRKKNKQTIRLKESELKRMIGESVSKILSEGKYVNNKPIDWNKISDDDVDTVIKKRSDRHYNRPNGGDVLARRQKQLDAAKRLGMEGDELDVFPDTVQARTEFYSNHPWRKSYRDDYVFPSHMKKKNELQSTEGGEGFQYLSNPSSLPAGWQ